MFAHLHVHSNFSFGAATMHPHEIVERAFALGYRAVALTDTNGTYATVPFYEKAREAGLRPILGAELDDPRSSDRAVVLARGPSGMGTVHRLVTSRQLDRPPKEFSLGDALAAAPCDIVILTASESLLERLAGRGGLFAELVSRPGGAREARRLYERSRELGVPVAATNAVRVATPGDHDLVRLLAAIRDLTTWSRVDPARIPPRDAWLKPPDAMRDLFRGAPEAIANAERIAEECGAIELDLGRWKFPVFPLPEFETAESYLQRIARSGFEKRYPDPSPEAVRRFGYELATISAMGFASYFLVVWDIARRAHTMGIPCLGRGSAGCSLIAYCLEITHVDPVRYDLYFERFLNPSRLSPPDIDLDIAWSARDRVLEEIYDLYGHDHVAMISTTNRYAARGAFREVAKALGLPESEVNRFTRSIPWVRAEALPTLGKTFPECRNMSREAGDLVRTILAAGARLADFPRHLGIHCGGIVVASGPLTDHLALQRAAKGLVVTQPDMIPVERLGLVKIDILGNRSLGVLPDALAAIRESSGDVAPDLSDHEALARDPETKALIREGRTMGCFYIESPAMRSLLAKLAVEDFLGLVAASSIIRPGVASSGMMQAYVERRADPAKVASLHPRMGELLAETLGVMVYQEDVLKVAHEIGGLSLAEADLLRRAMSGKTRSGEAFTRLEGRFFASAGMRGIEEPIAREIWRQIESFAGYSFCKAHSASFARLSYQVAWLKAHYPAQFMASVLANEGGFYGIHAYVSECRRMGLDVRGPDVNESRFATGSRPGGIVRLGLSCVKGVSRETLRAIDRERRAGEGPYESLQDLLARTPLSWEEAASLIKVGALDEALGAARTELLWELARARRAANRGLRRCSKEAAALLFDPDPDPGAERGAQELEDFDLATRLAWEIEFLGFPLSAHPIEILRSAGHIPPDTVSASEMDRHVGRHVRMAGWTIASKPILTRSRAGGGGGERMKILSLEDEAGTFEVVVFPRVYERYAPATLAAGILVEGKVEITAGVPALVADRIDTLPPLFTPPRAGAA